MRAKKRMFQISKYSAMEAAERGRSQVRIAEGKIKKLADMSTREGRIQWKKWQKDIMDFKRNRLKRQKIYSKPCTSRITKQ